MDMMVSYYTNQGQRENNEDWSIVSESGNHLLAVVADGLGGMDYGEVASRKAAAAVISELQGKTPDDDAIIDAIQKASQTVADAQIPGHPMRTTIAVLWAGEDTALAANVGDSRIYQFRNGEIIYQSTDHSVAQMSVLAGEISKEEIRSSSERNRLIRALGDSRDVRVDVSECTLQAGDRFLICSDGFWEPVLEEDMLHSMEDHPSAKEWLNRMRRIVEEKQNPRQDNHTAICILVGDAGCGIH